MRTSHGKHRWLANRYAISCNGRLQEIGNCPGFPSVVMITLVLFLSTVDQTSGAVTSFNSKSAWETEAGDYTTIDFTGYEPGTIITTQYQSIGVAFTEGNDRINSRFSLFPLDGWGLNGVINTFTLSFSQPMRTIACEFPGTLRFRLYSKGQLIHTSVTFGSVGNGFFGGLISDQPFDSVVVLDPQGAVFVDDLHFGVGIPVPSAIAILAIAILNPTRRRRE